MITKDAFIKAAGTKINAALPKLKAAGNFNDIGFSHRVNRLLKGAENMYFSLGNEVNEPVNAIYNHFSETPGMNDVSNVAKVDIIDIGIQATQQSVMGYLVAERAMNAPVDTAFYQTLRAVNEAGGFDKGSIVFNPFQPQGTKLNLGSAVTTIEDMVDGDNATNKALVKKAVTIVAKDGTGAVVATGTDFNGDGTIYFNNAKACSSATVNYDTGVVTVNDKAADVTLTLTANIERTGERDGASTLKVKPATEYKMIKAKPNRIILENSFEENAYMNKQCADMTGAGIQIDWGKRAINQLLQVFTYYLDMTAVKVVAESMLAKPASVELDLTDYLISSSQAATKNDIVNQHVLSLNKALQDACGKGPSFYLVDGEGAIVLGNNAQYFVGNPTFDQALDGLVGTYRGVPVIRHHALNGILDDENKKFGFIGAGWKDPAGQAAVGMYGEYLPPYSVTPALNFENPALFSQALLSMSTTEELVPELGAYMKVLVSSRG